MLLCLVVLCTHAAGVVPHTPCRSNARGDLMLSALNLTSHLMYDDVRYTLPGSNTNDKLAAAAGMLPAALLANGSNGGATRSYNQP